MSTQARSAAFRAKVALAAVRELETVSQLSSEHGVHPTEICQWKQQLPEGAERVFASGVKAENGLGSIDLLDSAGKLAQCKGGGQQFWTAPDSSALCVG